jgi:hypothetical protein
MLDINEIENQLEVWVLADNPTIDEHNKSVIISIIAEQYVSIAERGYDVDLKTVYNLIKLTEEK